MTSEKQTAGAAALPLLACIALCCLGPLSGLAQGGLSPVMPRITEYFASEPNAGMLVRLMISGLSAAMIFGALLSGFLSERVGQLRLLMICLVVYGLAGAAGYVLDNLYLIVASRIVLGVVNAAAGVLAMALITTRVAAEGRERWLGFYVVAGTIGTLGFTALIGFIGQFGWRNAFLVYLFALPVALFLALTFTTAPDEPEQAGDESQAASGGGGGIPWAKVLFGLVCGAIGTTTMMYLPFHLAAIGMGSPDQVAAILVFSGLFGAGFTFCYGWVRKVLSAIQLFVLFFILAGVGLVLVTSAQSTTLVYVGVALYGGGYGITVPNLFGACAAATRPEFRARMLGLVRAGFYAGPLVAQLGLETMLRRWGADYAVGGIAALCFIAAALALILRRKFVPVE
jgi:MFS family permease